MFTLEHSQHCAAVGLRIPLGRGRQVEFWYCPRGTVIPPHRHAGLDSFIVQLWGRMRWTVATTTREVCGPFRWRKSCSRIGLAAARVGAGVRHAAVAHSRCLFVNFERGAGELPSAAQDFELA